MRTLERRLTFRRIRVWGGAALLLAAGATWLLLDTRVSLDDTLLRMQGWGWMGFLVLGLLYVAASVLLVPGTILTLAAGFFASTQWPDRPWLAVTVGTALVSVSSVIGATVAFLLGRSLLRDWVARKTAEHPRFRALDDAIAREGFKVVFLMRLTPVLPFNVLNYAFGLTRVSLAQFIIGSWTGTLPATALFVYAGAAAHSLAAVVAGQASLGTGEAVVLGLGLLATLLLVVVGARMARNILRAPMDDEP